MIDKLASFALGVMLALLGMFFVLALIVLIITAIQHIGTLL